MPSPYPLFFFEAFLFEIDAKMLRVIDLRTDGRTYGPINYRNSYTVLELILLLKDKTAFSCSCGIFVFVLVYRVADLDADQPDPTLENTDSGSDLIRIILNEQIFERKSLYIFE